MTGGATARSGGSEDGGGGHAYAIRRARVLEELGGDVMVLPAAPSLRRSLDTEVRYRPDSNQLYLTGLEEPEAVVVLSGRRAGDRVTAFVRPRDREEEVWSGARLGVEGVRERLGAGEVHSLEEMEARLPALLQGAGRIHYRLGSHQRTEVVVLDALRWGRTKGAREGRGPHGVVDPGRILHPMRCVKDEHELRVLRRAAAITRAAFEAVATMVRPGVGEWEIEARLDWEFRSRGATGPAFPTIVGAGRNGCVLHYTANSAPVGEGELVVVDGGAEVDWYAADVTRTFAAVGDGAVEPRRAEILELVESARVSAIAAVRPGNSVADVHAAGTHTLVAGLVELGVLRGGVDDLIERKQEQAFFPHRISHWLGLDVHDPGDYASEGVPLPLSPGMVLTIEPGLYFSRARVDASPRGTAPATGAQRGSEGATPVFDAISAKVAARYEGIGVRIEDDVVVTGTGAEVLTR